MSGPFIADYTVGVFPLVESRMVAFKCLRPLHLNFSNLIGNLTTSLCSRIYQSKGRKRPNVTPIHFENSL